MRAKSVTFNPFCESKTVFMDREKIALADGLNCKPCLRPAGREDVEYCCCNRFQLEWPGVGLSGSLTECTVGNLDAGPQTFTFERAPFRPPLGQLCVPVEHYFTFGQEFKECRWYASSTSSGDGATQIKSVTLRHFPVAPDGSGWPAHPNAPYAVLRLIFTKFFRPVPIADDDTAILDVIMVCGDFTCTGGTFEIVTFAAVAGACGASHENATYEGPFSATLLGIP